MAGGRHAQRQPVARECVNSSGIGTNAVKLKEKLSAAGRAATLEQVETAGPVSLSATSAELVTRPATDPYDGLVLASSVQGGVLAAPMMSYLEQVPSLAGKRVACLVTGFFPAGWGRNQTVAQLQAICESKGATVCGSGSVGWFNLCASDTFPNWWTA